MLHRSHSGAMAPTLSGAPLLPRCPAPGGVRQAGRAILPASGLKVFGSRLAAEGREAARFVRFLAPQAAELGRRVGKDGLALSAAALFSGGFVLGLPALFDLVSK